MVVFSPTGEQLGSAVVPSPDAEREGCLAALDDALRTRLWRLGHRVKVGYYNPHTAEISLTPSERGAAFSASRPIPIDSGGLLAALDADSEPERLVLSDGTVAIRQSPTYRDITRRLVEIRDRHGVDPTIRPGFAGFR